MLKLLDVILFASHFGVIGFNLTGWIWKKTRRLHLIFIGCTLFSWAVLGIWYGFGYCVLTDCEWDVKRQLGEQNLPSSFVAYVSNNVLGMNLSPQIVDFLTGGPFALAIGLSIYFNFFKKLE